MKRYLIITLIFCLFLSLFGNTNKVNYIPLMQYEHLNYGGQTIYSPAGGLLVMGSNFQVVGIYSNYHFKNDLSNSYPDQFHSLDFLAESFRGRHHFVSLLKSESDKPISGGLHTFQLASVWGYEIVSRENFQFVLGSGIGISDFGIDMSNGKPLPLIPLPLIRMKSNSKWLNTKLDFITGPNFEFIIAPQKQTRLKGDFRIDNLRDERDIIFDLSGHYRFFSSTSSMGDFAGLAIGLANNNIAFDLAEKDEIFDYHYYSLYSELDLSFLKISGAYTFKNREMYREEEKINFDDGFTFSIQALYQF